MKLLAVKKEKCSSLEKVDGYVLPLENFSVSYHQYYSLQDIQDFMLLEPDKEFFVVINKPIFNCEVKLLDDILMQLEKFHVSGVFFYDLSILSIAKRLELDILLVWNQTHMVTNYNTINYYFNKGAKGAMLANEITFDEMCGIREHSNSVLFANLIYRPVMSFSRRKLMSNYYNALGVKEQCESTFIHEKITDMDYLVQEEADGTSLFYGNIVNSTCVLDRMRQLGFDYGIVDLSCLDDKVGMECLEAVWMIIHEVGHLEFCLTKIADLIGNCTGFLYKKTIYRVK